MTPLDKQKQFEKAFHKLLKKYKVSLSLDQIGTDYLKSETMVAIFDYDESFFDDHGTGIIPDLVLGTYVSGK